jgi:hypothetical protein
VLALCGVFCADLNKLASYMRISEVFWELRWGFELNSKNNVLIYQTRSHSRNFSCISRYLFALVVSGGWSLDHPLHKRRFTKCELQEQDSTPYRTVLLQKPIVSQLLKKFPFHLWTRQFIPVLETISLSSTVSV